MGRYSKLDITSRLQSILADSSRDRPPTRPTRSVRRLRRLTEPEVDQLVECYQQGTPINVLARDLGVHRTTISAQLKARGVLAPTSQIDDAAQTEIVRLYQTGLSLAQVAKHLGMSENTVHRVLKRAGVATRPVGTN